jgi:glycosyltransferase involved in cell wall biosynthesis
MNVLNVCANFDPVTGGGEAERTFQMCKSLLSAGERCRVLTVDGEMSEQRKKALGKDGVIALPCLLKRFYVPRVSLPDIQRFVDDADVIHLIGHWSVLNALVYRAIRKVGKPYVVCPAGALAIFGRSKFLKQIYNFLIGNQIIKNAQKLIAVTPEERDYFVSSGASPDKVVVIPNGIAESDFQSSDVHGFRRKHALVSRRFILFVGRMNLIKGPDLLLRAFCHLKDKHQNIDLVFVGPDGGLLTELQSLVQMQGAESRVHFVGYLGRADKSDAYHAAELLVIPSRHEAMSIVALEAGVCGTPVVLTDQCGFNQLEEKGCGWVVPATVEGLQRGLDAVLSNPGCIGSAASGIKKYVTEYYSWDVVVQLYRNLYSQLSKDAS